MPETSGITGCILAQDGVTRIEEALISLRGWTDQIIVIVHGNDEVTAEIAARYADIVLPIPDNYVVFDTLHELAIEPATGEWIFYLSANERVPSALGPALRRLLTERGNEFAAVSIPTKHYFCGKWIEHSGWWPGYTRPQLLKKGAFRFLPRLQTGLEIQGATFFLSADDPDFAIIHHAFDTIHRYQERLDAYSETEALRLDSAGELHTWQAMLAHFAQDWQSTYEAKRADLDGMHGFIIAFQSAFSQFSARAKLWDRRTRRNGAPEDEKPASLPASVAEMLEFMVRVCCEGAEPWLSPSPDTASTRTQREPLVYAIRAGEVEAARSLLDALRALEESVAIAVPPGDALPFASQVRHVEATIPAATRITQAGMDRFRAKGEALVQVACAQFPTDRLPIEWAAALASADRIWVSSEFNRSTFVRGGIPGEKIAVIAEILDPALWEVERKADQVDGGGFTFLAPLEWEAHAGWDVLLEAFASAFLPEENIRLRLQVAPSVRLTPAEIEQQASAWLQARTRRTLEEMPHIRLHHEAFTLEARLQVYREVQAAVFPSRGDGTGRALLEAMATGLPTIATLWSSATEFYNRQVGFPLQCRVSPVTEETVHTMPQYAGHWWAEPNLQDLQRQMRTVIDRREEARRRGEAARAAVQCRYSPAAVAPMLKAELARCHGLAAERAASIAQDTPTVTAPPALPKRSPLKRIPLDTPPAVDLRVALGRSLNLRWQSPEIAGQADWQLQRELIPRLQTNRDIHLIQVPESPRVSEEMSSPQAALLSAEPPPDVTIKGDFPTDARHQNRGKLVVWPSLDALVRSIKNIAKAGDELPFVANACDEIWTPTRWVRDAYVRRGVPAERVRLVPMGVRTDIFTPEGTPFDIGLGKTTRFLFVGPLLPRSGADLLLQAYIETFRREDDVCLIISETEVDNPETESIRRAYWQAQSDPMAPIILMAPVDMADRELASLYRSATCLVSPFRNEPVAMSVLQGMACGLPIITTSEGAADDYLDDSIALRIPSYRGRALRIGEAPPPGTYEEELEPNFGALRQALRWIAHHPEEARKRGNAARAHILTGWTWDRSVAVIRDRLQTLTIPAVQPERQARRWVPTRKFSEENPEITKAPRRRTPKKIELSLCLIARNEEARIRYCLESIAPFVDEMIVVDTGSTDRTREIAWSCGARVFDFPWTDSFSEARNQSLALARGEWIFWMDADDVISPECGTLLRQLVHRHPDKEVAYQVQVHIPPGPTEFSTSVVDHVKLFPNRSDIRFEHRIHEQVLPALRRANLQVLPSDAYVVHEHYDRTDSGQAQKRRRDFHLLELDLREHPEHPFVLFNLGMTHLYATQEFEVAAQYLQRSLNGMDWRTSIVRKAYALLCTARICQQDWQTAAKVNEQGRKHYPHDAELLFLGGQIYANLDRYEEAREAFEHLVYGKEDAHYRSVDMGLRTYRGHHELALLHRQRGNAQRCAQLLQEISERYPDYLPARLDLVDTLCSLQQEATAKTLLLAIPRSASVAPQLQNLYMRLSIEWPTDEAT